MNRTDPLNVVANVFAVLGFLPVMLFVLFYGVRSQWRATLVGRALMYQSAAFTLVLAVVMVGIWWPDMPGRALVRLICYGLLVITMWRMFFTLLHYQNEWDRAKQLASQIEKPIVPKD